ncbi:MAG: flavin reductase [Spirochaetales bacterium]|nr:flavin reductase [Spirochaetales bacterium]
MKRQPIDISRLSLAAFRSWDQEWFLLTAGDFEAGRYNSMTVGWGGFGVMWKKPMALVVVRPTRHTRGFMDEYPDFTLCGFGSGQREALEYCGNHSGREVDKIARCGLTPVASSTVRAPGLEEAELIVECRQMYRQDFDPALFLADFITGNYPDRDYHRMYLGEVLAVSGISRYRGSP